MDFDEQVDDLKYELSGQLDRERRINADLQSSNAYMDRMNSRDGWVSLAGFVALLMIPVAIDYWPIVGRLL